MGAEGGNQGDHPSVKFDCFDYSVCPKSGESLLPRNPGQGGNFSPAAAFRTGMTPGKNGFQPGITV